MRKLVKGMISDNQAIITETLDVTNMVKNHSLSKSIMDASWGMFLSLLTQKCKETGRVHIKIDQFFPSSKTCSACGLVREKLDLSERSWVCVCGAEHYRDINAAMNLLLVGLQELYDLNNLAAGWSESINATQVHSLSRTTLLARK